MRMLLWLLLLALPLSAQEIDHAALHPADTLLYLEADGGALADGMPQLDVMRMVADPKMRDFFKPAFEQLKLDPEKPVASLMKYAPIRAFLDGKATFGLSGVTVRMRTPDGNETSFVLDAANPLKAKHMFQTFGAAVRAEILGIGANAVRIHVVPRFLLTLEPGPKLKQMLGQVMGRLEQKAIQLGERQVVHLQIPADRIEENVWFAPEVYADMTGDRWIIASSTEAIQKAWQGGPRGSLANSRRFLDVRERMTGGARVAFMFADVAQVATILGPLVPPLLNEAGGIAGIKSIRGAGFGVSLVEGGVRESFGVVLDGEPKGVWTLLDAFPGGLKSVEIAPPGAVMVVGAKFDAKILVDRAQAVAAELLPGTEGFVKQGLAMASKEAGFDVEREIINALGDEVALIMFPPSGMGLPIPNWVIGVDVADEQDFNKLLERVKAMAQGEVNFQPVEVMEGVQGFQLLAPIPVPEPPIFAVAKGHFFGASSKELLGKVLTEWGQEGQPSLVKDGPVFSKVLKGLNGGDSGNVMALAYLNIRDMVPHVMPWANMVRLPADWFDQRKMPTADMIQPYLSGVAVDLRRDGNGVTLDAFSPVGLIFPMAGFAAWEAQRAMERQMVRMRARRPDAAYIGINMLGSYGNGVTVYGTVDDGPAHNAGLKRNDTILSIGGNRVRSLDDLRRVSLLYKPGDTVTLKVQRGNETIDVKLTYGRRGDFER